MSTIEGRVGAAAAVGCAALFQGLSPEELDEATRAACVRRIAKGDAVFEQDAPATALFVLVEGRIKVAQTTQDGQQVVVHYVSPGGFFGFPALAPEGAYPGTATAVTDCVLLAWNAAVAARLLERHPRIALNAIRGLVSWLEEAHLRLRELATERVERRLAHALLRLARQTGKRVPGGVAIGFPISRQDIAEMTGTTLHTASRVLSGWEADGIIRGGRRKITLVDPHRLVIIAEDLPPTERPGQTASSPPFGAG